MITYKEQALAAQARDELPLVDEVHVAAQRRAHPRIARDAQAFMRLRMHAQPHLPRGLDAVDAGEILFGEQLAPGAVGGHHEFRDGLFERRAALSRLDRHAAALDLKYIVELRGAGARPPHAP